jgi:hypothetical protein
MGCSEAKKLWICGCLCADGLQSFYSLSLFSPIEVGHTSVRLKMRQEASTAAILYDRL